MVDPWKLRTNRARELVPVLLENDYIVLSQQYFSLAYCCFGTFTLILAVTAENSRDPNERPFPEIDIPQAKDYQGLFAKSRIYRARVDTFPRTKNFISKSSSGD